MKTNIKYLFYATCILMGGLIFTTCSEDYDYKSNYSAHKNVTMTVKYAKDGVLETNIENKLQITLDINPETMLMDNQALIFAIEDPSIISIDKWGMITPKIVGETKVTITFRGDKNLTTSCIVRVEDVIYAIDEIIAPDPVEVGIDNMEYNLMSALKIIPSNATNKKLTFVSETPSIVTIDETGKITPVALGAGVIAVSTTDDSNITIKVNMLIILSIDVTSIVMPEMIKDNKISMGTNQRIDLPLLGIGVLPNSASNKTLAYTVTEGAGSADVDANGVITSKVAGEAKIKISATDGSDVSTELTVTVDPTIFDLARWTWTSTQSHARPADSAIKNEAYSHIDGDNTTALSLVKPGKDYDGIKVGADEVVFMIVDRGNNDPFNYFRITHRSGGNVNLRVWKVSFYGSADGKDFTPIQEGIDIPDASTGSSVGSGDLTLPESTHRYIKMTYDAWSTASASSMQIAEFNLGKK